MAVAFNRFDCFVYDLGRKIHDLTASGDVLKVYLSNTAPTASDTQKATGSATEISAGNGYTAGGEDVVNTWTKVGATGECGNADYTQWDATGQIGPFRYAVLYNDTAANDPLIGWWDTGSPSTTLQNGESFKLDYGATLFVIGG